MNIPLICNYHCSVYILRGNVLHWLRIPQQIDFKLAALAFRCLMVWICHTSPTSFIIWQTWIPDNGGPRRLPRPSSFHGHVTWQLVTGRSVPPHPRLERPATRRHLINQLCNFSALAEDICFCRVTVTDFSYRHLYSGFAVTDLRYFKNTR